MFMWYLLPMYKEIMMWILIFTTITSSFWLGLYSIKKKTINTKLINKSFLPKISVIIPVLNAEKVIGPTLKSIFSNNYPKNKIDVIIVDDGSTDNTSGAASKFPVRIMKHKKNMGKVNSLNDGISLAKNDIIFTLDDDSELRPNFFRLIVNKFKDKDVGAVCGIYKARYQNKLLERFQAMEYLGFALIRKLQESIDAVLVVPGSVAAFRKQALTDAGGFDDDTLLEDGDITLKIHKAGYKVACEKNALAFVSAPSTLKSFVSQRTRWMRGGMQIWGKHFDVFTGKLGAVGFLWMMDIVGVVMQFVVIGMFADKLLRFGISLAEIKMWIMNILTLNIQAVDIIVLLSMFLFTLGFLNMFISIKITNDSKKNLLWYPLMAPYQTFQFIIFIKSLILESLEVKNKW